MPSSAWSIITSPPLPGLPPATVGHVVMRADRGIALLDPFPEPKPGDVGELLPPLNPDAVARMRAGLYGSDDFGGVKGVRFGAIYPGHLPIIYRQIKTEDLMTLAADLEKAFAGEAPLSLTAKPPADPTTWVGLARRVLGADLVTPVPMPMLPPTSAPVMQPRPIPAPRQPVTAPPPSRRPVHALQAGGAVALALGTGLYAYQTGLIPRTPTPAPAPVTATAQPPDPAPADGTQTASIPIPQPAPQEPPPAASPESVETAQAPTQPEPPTIHDEASSVAPKPLKPVAEAPIEVIARPPTPAPQVSVAALIARGKKELELHDIKAARDCFERAAQAGDGEAARLLGRTFDPDYLAPDEMGFADRDLARSWYARAETRNPPVSDFERRFRAAVQRVN